jgi:hypothetical protein
MPARHLADEDAPMGRAYGLRDLIVFLHRAGLDVGEEDDIAASHLIWIGVAGAPPVAFAAKGPGGGRPRVPDSPVDQEARQRVEAAGMSTTDRLTPPWSRGSPRLVIVVASPERQDAPAHPAPAGRPEMCEPPARIVRTGVPCRSGDPRSVIPVNGR